MRFQRCGRCSYEATSRKSAAIRRRQAQERAALPLFASQIAAEQPSVEQVHERRRQAWAEQQDETRARRAAQWRRGRAELASLERDTREQLRDYWNRHRWLPGTPLSGRPAGRAGARDAPGTGVRG